MAGRYSVEWKSLSEEEWEHFKKANVISLVIMVADCAEVSNSEARRLIKAGAVAIDDIRLDVKNTFVELNGEKSILQVGKRKFFRIS